MALILIIKLQIPNGISFNFFHFFQFEGWPYCIEEIHVLYSGENSNVRSTNADDSRNWSRFYFMNTLQEALPVRLCGLHFINTVSFMDKVVAMLRPFMKKELMDVMYLHNTMDTYLEKHVPQAMMPNEYGGSAGTIKEIQETVYKQLQENSAFFVEEEETKRVNEKLRPGKPKSANDLFGTDGNFKQLSFD